jgi:integrase
MARPRTTNKHLPKYVTIIHGSFWWRPPKGKAERIGAADDEAAMYRWVADKLGPKPAGPAVTLNDLFDRYERDVLPTKEPRTQQDYRKHLLILRKTFGHMAPNDLLPEHVGQFLDVEKGKIQRNRMVSLLSSVYTKAVGRWRSAKLNPCIGVERNPSTPRDRLVTDAEFAAFYKLANPRTQVAMDLALLTGQRQGTLLKMKWSHITPEGILLQQANKGGKKGKRLLVEMSPALQAVLERARAFLPHLPREYVLRTRKGKPYTQNGFRACWQRTMEKYVARGGERFTFHDLRAKSASDSDTIQAAYERLGHTSMAMTRGIYDRGVRKVKPLR